MNKDIFDVLDNADDKMIERLSSFTDDNDEAKKRITEMSERKYQDLKAGISANEGKDKNEITMNVADKRPVRWYKPLAAVAAVAVLIAGAAKITGELEKYKAPNDGEIPAVQTETDSPAWSESVTYDQSGETYDTKETNSNIPSEEEMKELFGDFAEFYSDISNTLQISSYFEKKDFIKHTIVLNDTYRYFLINNKFSTLDEFNSYCSRFFEDSDCEINFGKKINVVNKTSDDPDIEHLITDDVDPEKYSNGFCDYMVIEVDGKLYLSETAAECFYSWYPAELMDNYFSERSFEVSENGFTRIRLSKHVISTTNALNYLNLFTEDAETAKEETNIAGIMLKYIKGVNNKWRIDFVGFNELYADKIAESGETAETISDTECYLELCPEYRDEILSHEENNAN